MRLSTYEIVDIRSGFDATTTVISGGLGRTVYSRTTAFTARMG